MRTEKRKNIIENYKKSSYYYSQYFKVIEKTTPTENLKKEKKNQFAKIYFEWAMSEWFCGNNLSAKRLFEKSYRLDNLLSESIYNIASIEAELDNQKESDILFNKYEHQEKLNEKSKTE